jgi:hypothetical protein
MRGIIAGLEHEVDEPIHYTWQVGPDCIDLTKSLGQRMRVRFVGEKRCIACQRKVSKLYQGGYCFPCVTTLAETDLCIVKPHECHHHLGTCRDDAFAQRHCMIPHTVYLACSSHAKVGITRAGRELTRWVDQGAIAALALACVPTRKMAGELEVEIAQSVADKTDWRKMVRGLHETVDLPALASTVAERIAPIWRPYLVHGAVVQNLYYPVLADRVPKAVSWSLDKTEASGQLIGVRGQYLLFDEGVLNVKKHAGMLVEVELA